MAIKKIGVAEFLLEYYIYKKEVSISILVETKDKEEFKLEKPYLPDIELLCKQLESKIKGKYGHLRL